MRIAITRKISPSMAACQLTHIQRQPIDLEKARKEHREYEERLREAGCLVHSLPAEPDLPDSVFVEDMAVVLPKAAILTRPGAAIRRAEVHGIAEALRPYRRLLSITAPATMDGGDVLHLGKILYVGLSRRTNEQAIRQLKIHLDPLGYQVTPVPVTGCLHLKSAVTQVSPDALLLNPRWVSPMTFPRWRIIEVHPAESSAANALWIGKHLIYPAAYPETGKRLDAAGLAPILVPAAEVAKAEGALTCCSLVFEAVGAMYR